ncbi:efflux transporter outer membrane subunit [Massilia sp. CF038]|uniref:efflux transporter outer membrane subunit n=1 Tax=Massilia sp. CF038 TaxID=1881045 RepID=UPI00091B2766|nr:efflux transporter outer membrane subunit [Massilia sp. CF038]SHG57235.1 efflux transporter, outer membrane factor (OMF) lipoprotein, NodT family [Massilia sp. CF038]
MRILTLTPLLAALVVSGCAVGPTYQVPATPEPVAFKEAAGWVAAAPADTLEHGPWWTLFNDPLLNQLVEQVEVSNQNVAAAVASYAQARALVQEQRASLFPSVGLNASGERSGGRNADAETSYRANIGASWEPDIWGRLRAGVSSAGASAAASQADLAAARLSAQGELAVNYFSLREADAARALLATTIEGYERVQQITRNRFDAGIAGKSDVLQAETQLANARVDELSLVRQRAQLEHAIAVLIGKAPADFALAPAQWRADVPDIPVGVPSVLLQRRPDIASAERRVAAANAQIGIARSAYYPNIGLSGSVGTGGRRVSDLFSASNLLWSLGTSVAQSLFNAGATRANVAGAEAQHQAAVARYRQTVLTAFGDVENQLSATRTLAQQQALRQQASLAADQAEAQMLNRYKAGQVSYTEVVQAQATALSARRALVQLQADRQTTAVALIQSLGGGWQASVK